MAYLCFMLPIALWAGDLDLFLAYEDGVARISLVVLVLILSLYYQDFYSNVRVRSKTLLLQNLILTIGAVFMTQAAVAYITPVLMMPRVAMILGCFLVVISFAALRIVYGAVLFKALGLQKLLFLGSNAVSRSVIDRIMHRPELGFITVGMVSNSYATGTPICGTQVLGPTTELRDIVSKSKPHRIIVGMTERRNFLPVQDLLDLRFQGIRIEEAASLYETVFGRVATQELRPSQLIYSTELGPLPGSMHVQTIYSVAIALICLLLAFPLMMVVALLVKLTSPGPVFFRQTRVGLNNVPFTLFKFRSMVSDAEAKTGAVWATKNDPRVTPIGRYLRKLRLDELPQLINVIRREMSIVGPRPERPEFVQVLSEKIPFYRQRHSVRPGITGWAQINYKYGETIEDTIIKLEYDLYYIKNLSPALDCYILFHTLKVMLFTQSGQ